MLELLPSSLCHNEKQMGHNFYHFQVALYEKNRKSHNKIDYSSFSPKGPPENGQNQFLSIFWCDVGSQEVIPTCAGGLSLRAGLHSPQPILQWQPWQNGGCIGHGMSVCLYDSLEKQARKKMTLVLCFQCVGPASGYWSARLLRQQLSLIQTFVLKLN